MPDSCKIWIYEFCSYNPDTLCEDVETRTWMNHSLKWLNVASATPVIKHKRHFPHPLAGYGRGRNTVMPGGCSDENLPCRRISTTGGYESQPRFIIPCISTVNGSRGVQPDRMIFARYSTRSMFARFFGPDRRMSFVFLLHRTGRQPAEVCWRNFHGLESMANVATSVPTADGNADDTPLSRTQPRAG